MVEPDPSIIIGNSHVILGIFVSVGPIIKPVLGRRTTASPPFSPLTKLVPQEVS